MKKLYTILGASLLTFSLALSGCGTKAPESGNASGEAKKHLKIGMVTATGTVNDNSFNQMTWESLQKFGIDTGAEVQYLQSASDSDIIPNLNQFIKDKWDLTFGVGFLMSEQVQKVAKDNPEAKIAIIDSVVDAPNVTSIVFKEHEGSYLAGVAAALSSKTGKIGFLGGIEMPVIKRFEAGFTAGAKAAKPDIKIVPIYTGAFDKPDLGKSTASTMFNQGVDIVFHAASSTGDGLFNEAKDRHAKGENVWVIGVDMDQAKVFGEDITMTSMVKRVDEATYRVSTDLLNGKFDGGKAVSLGLKENGVGLAESTKKNISDDIWKKIEEFKQKIINGEITVPDKM
ncbi:BMP family ABC transporter substrate-binding protein [Brevibacillus laterosporus]|nr:BMP family protein [Brevibacillus laterosporus]TPG69712.1 BMP family ABC transporter substrate-binding protein [Brevibacillus laterosporus]